MTDRHLFIIPARGGSKRLPRKNVRTLWGKPLIVHSIEAALGVSLQGERTVCVSSEDAEILACAERIPGALPVRRPPELAEDHVPTHPVLKHAVTEVEESQSTSVDIVWWMNASVPQVTSSDLAEGYNFLVEHGLREVTTVNDDGLAFAAVRLVRRDALFADALSTHFGVLKRNYLDVHTQEDLDFLEQIDSPHSLSDSL